VFNFHPDSAVVRERQLSENFRTESPTRDRAQKLFIHFVGIVRLDLTVGRNRTSFSFNEQKTRGKRKTRYGVLTYSLLRSSRRQRLIYQILQSIRRRLSAHRFIYRNDRFAHERQRPYSHFDGELRRRNLHQRD